MNFISSGRTKILAGRGSFIESLPLFSYCLQDYDALYIKKPQLLLTLNNSELVAWQGKHCALITTLGVYPRPAKPKLFA